MRVREHFIYDVRVNIDIYIFNFNINYIGWLKSKVIIIFTLHVLSN